MSKRGATIPAVQFGLSFQSDPALLGNSLASCTKREKLRIPRLDPNHTFRMQTMCGLRSWWQLAQKEPLYISGPTGAGKTSTVLQFCARLHLPVVSIMARPRMDRRELLGRYIMRPDGMTWQDGPASLAWRNGWTLVISEFSCAGPDFWVTCNDILEGLSLENDITGRVIPRHPNTRVIITDNTRGLSSTASKRGFLGRKMQDRSTIDRFWHIYEPGFTESEEMRQLAKTIPEALASGLNTQWSLQLCRLLAKSGQACRQKSQRRLVGFTSQNLRVSHRVLRRIRDILLAYAAKQITITGNPLQEALLLAHAQALDAPARRALSAIFQTTFDDWFRKELDQAYPYH